MGSVVGVCGGARSPDPLGRHPVRSFVDSLPLPSPATATANITPPHSHVLPFAHTNPRSTLPYLSDAISEHFGALDQAPTTLSRSTRMARRQVGPRPDGRAVVLDRDRGGDRAGALVPQRRQDGRHFGSRMVGAFLAASRPHRPKILNHTDPLLSHRIAIIFFISGLSLPPRNLVSPALATPRSRIN